MTRCKCLHKHYDGRRKDCFAAPRAPDCGNRFAPFLRIKSRFFVGSSLSEQPRRSMRCIAIENESSSILKYDVPIVDGRFEIDQFDDEGRLSRRGGQ